MNAFFETILNMTLTGSTVILIVLIFRSLMKNMPKKYLCFLWGIAAVRLLCPFSIESSLSIFNIIPIEDSVEAIKELPSAGGNSAVSPDTAAGLINGNMSTPAAVTGRDILPAVWLTVTAVFMILVVIKYIRCKRDLRNARLIEPGLFVGSMVDSPFVIGMVKPSIYLPEGLTEHEKEYLVMHEKMHIKRRDIWFKALWIMILAIHWFNPLVWIAFRLFCRDMEMSCDEEVIAEMGDEIKKDYSISLVTFAMKNNRPKFIVLPVAFNNWKQGGKEVKMRIKNILEYKGATKIITVTAALAVTSIAVLCLFNGVSNAKESNNTKETVETVVTDPADQSDKDKTVIAPSESEKTDVTEVIDVDGTPDDQAVPQSSEPYENLNEDKGPVSSKSSEPDATQPATPFKDGSRDAEERESAEPQLNSEGLPAKPEGQPIPQPSEPYTASEADQKKFKEAAESKRPYTESAEDQKKFGEAAESNKPYTSSSEAIESYKDEGGKNVPYISAPEEAESPVPDPAN